MAFNTTSFVAGASAVVAVLSTGLAGGYYLASPSHIDPPNRLQRLAAANQDSKPAAITTQAPVAAKPEIVADVAPAVPAAAAAVPAAAPVVAAPEAKISDAKASEAAHPAAVQETAAPAPTAKPDTDAKATEKVNADKARAVEARSAEARAAERKRSETRKIAEQQRKQRELDVATVAVRRIIHERGPSDIVVDSDQAEAPAPEMTHFNLFGQ